MLGNSKCTRPFVLVAICALATALAAPAFAAADWGAIAVSPHSGKVGVGYDYPTARRAKQRALHQCHQLGCRLAVWVYDQYAALVLKRNGVFVAGVGPTKNLAFAKARERAHEPTAKKYAWVYRAIRRRGRERGAARLIGVWACLSSGRGRRDGEVRSSLVNPAGAWSS